MKLSTDLKAALCCLDDAVDQMSEADSGLLNDKEVEEAKDYLRYAANLVYDGLRKEAPQLFHFDEGEEQAGLDAIQRAVDVFRQKQKEAV